MDRREPRAGFTLIELLVTLILLGLLTAVVFPVVVQQIDDAEPTKTANDLVNIRTGIDVFRLNVRPRFPGDLEDLVHQVDPAEDDDVTGSTFGANSAQAWNGPYIDASIIEDVDAAADQQTGDAVLTGFGLYIQNQLVCYDATTNTFDPANGAITCTEGTDFVAVLVGGAAVTTGTPGTEFLALDDLLDNGDGVALGKVRAAEADGAILDGAADAEFIVYLAAPYTN